MSQIMFCNQPFDASFGPRERDGGRGMLMGSSYWSELVEVHVWLYSHWDW